MKNYKVTGVRKDRTEGREHIILADLATEDGNIAISGTLKHILDIAEQRNYHVTNLAQAKEAYARSQG